MSNIMKLSELRKLTLKKLVEYHKIHEDTDSEMAMTKKLEAMKIKIHKLKTYIKFHKEGFEIVPIGYFHKPPRASSSKGHALPPKDTRSPEVLITDKLVSDAKIQLPIITKERDDILLYLRDFHEKKFPHRKKERLKREQPYKPPTEEKKAEIRAKMKEAKEQAKINIQLDKEKEKNKKKRENQLKKEFKKLSTNYQSQEREDDYKLVSDKFDEIANTKIYRDFFIGIFESNYDDITSENPEIMNPSGSALSVSVKQKELKNLGLNFLKKEFHEEIKENEEKKENEEIKEKLSKKYPQKKVNKIMADAVIRAVEGIIEADGYETNTYYKFIGNARNDAEEAVQELGFNHKGKEGGRGRLTKHGKELLNNGWGDTEELVRDYFEKKIKREEKNKKSKLFNKKFEKSEDATKNLINELEFLLTYFNNTSGKKTYEIFDINYYEEFYKSLMSIKTKAINIRKIKKFVDDNYYREDDGGGGDYYRFYKENEIYNMIKNEVRQLKSKNRKKEDDEKEPDLKKMLDEIKNHKEFNILEAIKYLTEDIKIPQFEI